MADGTAPQCGRVGSCHIHLKCLDENRGIFAFEAVLKLSTIKSIMDQIELLGDEK
jgi:hypothetical protein